MKKFMCILLSDCINTIVIRLTNKRAQIAGSTNNLVWRFKKNESLGARKDKLVHKAGHVSKAKDAAC